jgi:hypothetical protein
VSRRGGGKLRHPQSSLLLLLLLLLVRRNLGGRLYLLGPRKLMALVQSIEGECFWLVIFIFVSKTESISSFQYNSVLVALIDGVLLLCVVFPNWIVVLPKYAVSP